MLHRLRQLSSPVQVVRRLFHWGLKLYLRGLKSIPFCAENELKVCVGFSPEVEHGLMFAGYFKARISPH